jgi:hypothetical protein
MLIVSEMKTPDGKDLRYQFFNYWFILCVIMIWIPTILMIFAYNMISFKLRLSLKAFPYLSQQSRIARSRQKVIQMLFVLIIIELICWAPWQIYILIQFIFYRIYPTDSETGIRPPLPEVSSFQSALKVTTKGQLISKCLFGVIVWTKKQRNFFQDFCPSL